MRKSYDIIAGGKKITVSIDVDALIENFKKSRFGEFDESFGSYGYMEGDPTMTQEEYEKNKDSYIADIRSLDDVARLTKVVENWPKKKNGLLNRKNVKYLVESPICQYICEWHNTWIYHTVKAVASTDDYIDIVAYEKVDTPA